MTIRQYAKKNDHDIKGKLKRNAEWEKDKRERWYVDEAGNEYMKTAQGIVIITAEGTVI